MPPIGAAIGAAVTGLGASVASALTGAAFSGFALRAFTQIAVGVALSAVGRMLAPKPRRMARRGVRTSVGFGEDAPATIVLGRYATAGDLVYAGSFGPDDDTYVLVLELGDLPARLRRLMVNGAWVTLSATAGDRGRGVVEYRTGKGEDTLWVAVFDGTQTAPCAYLLDAFGDDPQRPWKSDMVGRGIPYAVVSVRYDPKIHRGVPELLFELDGLRLYDPRRDSSVGGAGPQRWSAPATWSGSGDPANDNPVVQIYNLMLGLPDPVTGAPLWGGSDIAQRDLPLSSWFAAMNACDAAAAGADGVEPSYRAGVEIALDDDAEPADVIEDLLAACQGGIAEVAGQWVIRAGAPGAAVFAFSDDDVVVTSPEELDPFPGLDGVWNGIAARYPEPEDGWADKEAPLRLDAGYLAADGGRRRVAALGYPTVPYRSQVQRLTASALRDGRRFRRHSVVLPPEARALGPLDVVAWTSARHGYASKAFTVDLSEDLPNGCVALALREVDPADYDFAAGELLPATVGFLGRPPRLPRPADFGAEGVSLPDATGTARRPAIRLDWNPLARAAGVRYQLQLEDRPDDLPLLGGHDTADDDGSPSLVEVFAGEPLEVEAGTPLVAAYVADVVAGTTLVTAGVLPAAAYRIRARYVPNGDWCPWIAVTTPDTRVSALDLDATLNARIDAAQTAAEASANDAAVALATASAARGIAEALAGDTVAELEALLAALGGLDAGDVVAANLLSLRALQTGWNNDPTFQKWTTTPDHWTLSGLSATATQFTGFYGAGLDLDVASGAIGGSARAASDVSGEMDAGDPNAEWVVLYALVTVPTGTTTSFRIRPEWKISATWTRGDMKGLTAPVGTLAELGIAVTAGLQQGIEVLVKKPAGAATAVSVLLEKDAAVTSAAHIQLHLLGLRRASDAEIAAGAAASNLAAAVSTLNTTITGVSTALAASQTALGATVSDISANLAANYVTTANLTSALAALETELSAEVLDDVSANLAVNYYTRAQSDDAIDEAIAAFGLTLSSTTIEGLTAQIADEVATRATADSALAGRISTMEARKDPGALNTNGSFATGTFLGWTGQAPLTGFTPPTTFAIVAKGGTVSAQQNAPSPFMLKMATDAVTNRALIGERFEAKPGDSVSLSAMYAAGGSTPSVSLRFVIRALETTGAAVTGGAFSADVTSYTATAWARFTSPTWGPLPAGTAFVRVEVCRLNGGAGDAYVTGVDGRKVEPAALARITATETVATSAQSAIASLTTNITTSFGSQAAFLSAMSAVVGSNNLRASTYVLRQRAGAAVGNVEAVAFATPDGTALSTFKLDYDYIDLEGRVSARDLVISSGVNLVPDDQLQEEAIWEPSAEWQVFPTTNIANATSIGEVRYVGTGTTGNAISTGKRFPVVAGQTYAVSFRCRGNGTQFRAYAQLYFYDAAGAPIVSPTAISFGVTLSSSAATVAPAAEVIAVPAGAFQAAWRWVVDRVNTVSPYVRFFAPSVRVQAGAIHIADGAITAPKINVTDLGAVVATLGTCTITSALNFAPGVVVTGAIGLNAVTDVGAAVRGAALSLAVEDTWYDLASYAVNIPAGSAVILSTDVMLSRGAQWVAWVYAVNWSTFQSGDYEYRLLRGSTVVFSGLRNVYVDADPGTGTKVYKLQMRSVIPGGEPRTITVNGDVVTAYTHPQAMTTTALVGYAHVIVQLFKR